MTAITQSLTITRRNLLQVLRSPELLVFNVVQPIILVLLFVYVFGGAIDTPAEDYADFLLPGIAVFTVAFASANTAIGMSEDLTKGIMDRFRSLPIARSAVLTGRILADTVKLLVSVALIVVVGLLVGFTYRGGWADALLALAVLVSFGVAFSWVAAWIGLALRNPEAVTSGGFLWLYPVTFASSAFVPVATLPPWLRGFSEINPATVTIDALRALVAGQPPGAALWQSLAWSAGILAVFATLSVVTYRRVS